MFLWLHVKSRFSNLTDEQVQRIREGEPAANPIEKTILWRILKFWRLNIQLLFVTDGMRKPGKGRWGGRGGGKLDDDCTKMLHQMFDRLKVPYHRAPGEAEAECARLQQLGIVDAVWSDDGDCLMFGCTTMIKANRTSAGKKEWLERITVYQAETVLPRFDLDRDSLVCFAVLTGGDYDTAGLPNCGFQTARKLAQRHVGLAYDLKMCQTAPDFARWRMLLASSLAAMHKAVSVPPNFPNVEALNGYRNPAISTDDQCFNLRGLRGGWEWLETQIDQPKLRIVLRDHYNFTTKEYLKHMGPVFLARALTRGVTPARREENLSYGVQLRRTLKRKGQDGEEGRVKSELNIKFNAWMLVDINLTSQDSVNADGSAYDPMKRIDGVMLKCFLEHGLPQGALDKPESPTTKKGKARSGTQEEDGASATPSASQNAPPSSAPIPSTSARKRMSQDAPEGEVVASQSKTAKKRRKTAEKEDAAGTPKKSRQRKPKVAAEEPPPPTFKRVDMPDFAALKRSCNVVDLDEEDTDDEIEILAHPSQSTLSPAGTPQSWHQTSRVPRWPSLDTPLRANTGASPHETNFRIPADPLPSSSGTIDETNQDEASAAAMLRQRRERGLLSKLSSQTAASTRSEPPAPPRPPAPYEIIDLT
ncbi:DNA repair protein RAD2 [Cercospora beticola]|uniref:DNA repair protein RAD2 n=2 Tax=Cercospora beticola TaxID=122368 RepID=A0A2G5I3B3_CERBT|nr:DNA repair protein RAD2 [Cercospora beticola]PIA99295.1 DNA repair protein RAD2 [Cercospora beticola]